MALAHSLGVGLTPDVTCRFSREEGTGWNASMLCVAKQESLESYVVLPIASDRPRNGVAFEVSSCAGHLVHVEMFQRLPSANLDIAAFESFSLD